MQLIVLKRNNNPIDFELLCNQKIKLSDYRIEKIRTLVSYDSKKESLISELFQIYCISLLSGMAPGQIAIERSQNGKPFCKNFIYNFSVSHSYDYMVFTYASIPIGVDIEKHRNIYLKNDFFFQQEIEAINKSIDSEKEKILLWTKKEAVIKCYDMKFSQIRKIDTVEYKDKLLSLNYDNYSISICCEKIKRKKINMHFISENELISHFQSIQ